MELYKNTADNFIEYLVHHGYPQNSIVLEYATKNKLAVDVVVLADDLKTPIAAYEIKGKKNIHSFRRGIEHMKKVAETLPLTVSMSLVFEIEQAPYFQVLDVSGIVYGNEDYNTADLLNTDKLYKPIAYKTINTSSETKKLLKKADKLQEKMDSLALICWLLILPISIILMVLDAFDVYSLNTERLILLGAIVIIFILPFYSEISIKDVYMKRNDKIKTILHRNKKK